MKSRILRIDTTWEVLTAQAWGIRQGSVYPQFITDGYDLVPPLDPATTIASRKDVARLAADQSIKFITGVGHGKMDQFLGDFDESIFPMNVYSSQEVSGKIVHFLSCASAARLGPDFIQKGCRAFIGYNAPFVYDPAWSAVFFRCDYQVDLALSAGKWVVDALQAARQQFDVEIRNPVNATIAAELKSRRDSLVALGPNLQISINT